MQNNVLPSEKIYLPDGTELRLCTEQALRDEEFPSQAERSF